jgi:S1-C subfamily serine protease
MHTRARTLTLAALALLPALAQGQERDRLADALALQEAVQQSIERVEPSIACILVSRSEAYREFGAAPSGEPGKLGRFHPPAVRPEDSHYSLIRRLSLHSPETTPESFGSGVVLDETGLVLTQAHVVRKAAKVFVRLPSGRGSYADVHASDPRSDLAVLRLLDRVPNLKPLKFGDGGKLRKGSFVLSLSNPFAAGFRDGSPSASWGIVSNVRRRSTGQVSEIPYDRSRHTVHHSGTLIQTDTRLNLGCSGGALLNLEGELVGLTSSMAALSGGETPGGFAVPVDDRLRRIIDVLRRGEEVEYGFLGVNIEGDAGAGVHLSRVMDNSPAQKGGLRGGDYVVAINGVPVRDSDDLFLLVGMQLAGSTVRVEAAQTPAGPRRTCVVKLAKYPMPGPVVASSRPAARGGLRVDYTSVLTQASHTSIPAGVVIREVVADSPAARARLRLDTRITRVNGHEVNAPAEFYREMDAAAGPAELTFINFDGQEERLTLDGK